MEVPVQSASQTKSTMSAAGAGDASAVTGMEPLGRSGLGPLSPSNPKTSFDPEKCSAYFKQCATHLHDIPIEPFLQACEEIKKIIGTLGPALGMAASDITEKVGYIHAKEAELRKDIPKRGQAEPLAIGQTAPADSNAIRFTLQWMVADEMARNVHARNDWTYVSGARSLLRLMWFLDFVFVLLTRILDMPQEALKDSATAAYESALAPHHPWILRKTISAALSLLPSKEIFLKNLAGPAGGENKSDFPTRLQAFVATIDPVRQELWRLYKEKNLTELP